MEEVLKLLRAFAGPTLVLSAILLAASPLLAGEEKFLPGIPPIADFDGRYPPVTAERGATLRIQVALDREPGEESGPPDTWPKERLLVKVVPLAGGGEPGFFALDLAYGWRFLEWGQGPGREASFSETHPEWSYFRVARKEINRDDPGQVWQETRFQVRVGLEGGFYSEIE